MSKGKILSESFVLETCKHNDEPRPTVPASRTLPDVVIDWECGLCGATFRTRYKYGHSSSDGYGGSGPYWAVGKREQLTSGKTGLAPVRDNRSQMEIAGG